MSNDIAKTWNEQVVKAVAPAREVNRLAVAKLEKVLDLQLTSLVEYAELGLGNLKSGLEVKDAESFKRYAEGQAAVARQVSEKVLRDARALAEVGREFGAEVQEVVQASLPKAA